MKEIDSLLQHEPLYPFRFTPLYKNYIWGGEAFRTLFGRSIPENGLPLAESWEIVDHPNGTGIIENGPLRGVSLHNLLLSRPQDLLGEDFLRKNGTPPRFPLILKYLDAKEPLSVQVHPNDILSEEMQLNDPGKTEVWVVVQAKPDSCLWLGTDQDYLKHEFEEIIRRGDIKQHLNRIKVDVGDCFYLRPGTIHALGAGIVVAEVQTASDITFRIHDWDRLDANGLPRELKIEESIRALPDLCTPIFPQSPKPTKYIHCDRLVEDEYFTVNRWVLPEPMFWKTEGHCHIWTVLEGTADVVFTAGRRVSPQKQSGRESDPDAIEVLRQGDSILVPAMCPGFRLIPENREPAVLLNAVVR